MSEKNNFLYSSIGKKVLMSLSAFFLLFFLIQHLAINFTSVLSENIFNELSHFMGTNPLVQFLLQPILIFGVVFHFVLGFILEIKNHRSRNIKYAMNKGNASSHWTSRNMVWSGLFILFFLAFHFYDFWIPEITYKYIQCTPEDPNRYYNEVVHMFHNPMRVLIYVLSFVFLSLHLLHGFQSAFQSIGMRYGKYIESIQLLGRGYAILVPLGFIFIALFHYIKSL